MQTTPSSAARGGPIRSVEPLGFPWKTPDPFLFCVHHDDAYPRGDKRMAPVASLADREIGGDFSRKDGFSMYHGTVVPGFPAHPHCGFETVTVVRRGLVDHSDSLGAAARYGRGDVQWLTTGRGVVHAEMFPLVERDRDNPLELFQIWLNLPRATKRAAPYFTMHWADAIPRRTVKDAAGRTTEITIVAGRYDDATPLAPPPESWASRPEGDVAIWTLKLAPHARFTIPPARAGSHRTLYFFRGASLRLDGRDIAVRHAIALRAELPATIENGDEESELLMLQGRPIGEPVVQHGPFVATSPQEIQSAIAEYRRTQYGGWPWSDDAPVHPREEGRFARHVDGRIEKPGG
jgi:redox-sensitive bicupin YhaK (pirin superfamily)